MKIGPMECFVIGYFQMMGLSITIKLLYLTLYDLYLIIYFVDLIDFVHNFVIF